MQHSRFTTETNRVRFSKLAVLFLAVIYVLIAGCGRSAPKGLTILISGDTQGWITPCGCASNQSGGLPRRGAYVDDLRQKSDVLLLDVGGSATTTGEYQTLKLTSLLTGASKMGLALHNIGGSESAFSPSELQELGEKSGVQWMSANLLSDLGQRGAITSQLLEMGGIKVGITGVIDPALVEHSEWQVQEPVRSVLSALDGMDADVKVVLAYFDEAGLRKLAESLPEVDYIIGGPTGQCMSPTRVGPVTMLSVTNKGKFLGRIDLQPEESGFTEEHIELVEISSTLPQTPVQLDNLAEYHSLLAKRDFTAFEAKLDTFEGTNWDGMEVAGSRSCAKCHELDQNVWHDSKHSHAWEVLVLKDSQFDPHCQQCHTTGYSLPGGFVNVAQSENRVHVGCENCHGPSKAHVDDPRTRTPFQAKEQCVRCHDHENSPLFELDPYWKKIFHEGKKST